MQQNVSVVVKQMNEQVSFAVNESSRVSETTTAVEGMTKSVYEMADDVVQISELVAQQMKNIEHTSHQSRGSGGYCGANFCKCTGSNIRFT